MQTFEAFTCDVERMLDKHSGEWLATWFESTNSFLGGKRPRELLLSDPASVIEDLAKDVHDVS